MQRGQISERNGHAWKPESGKRKRETANIANLEPLPGSVFAGAVPRWFPVSALRFPVSLIPSFLQRHAKFLHERLRVGGGRAVTRFADLHQAGAAVLVHHPFCRDAIAEG